MHPTPCGPRDSRPDGGHPDTDQVLFLIGHGLAGMLAGWITVALLLWSDVGGLGTLVAASDLWPVPLIMLLASFGFTFASLALGTAALPVRGGESRRAGRAVRLPVPLRVRARARPEPRPHRA